MPQNEDPLYHVRNADHIPVKFESVAYLLIEFINLFVKNTRYSKGYICVFCLDLENFYPKSKATPSTLIGMRIVRIRAD